MSDEKLFDFFLRGGDFIYKNNIILIAIMIIFILSLILIFDKLDAYFKKRNGKDENSSQKTKS